MHELHQLVTRKKALLGAVLAETLQWLADNAASLWAEPARLDWVLQDAFNVLPYCRLLYALECNGVQRSANVAATEIDTAARGQSLAHRPYLEDCLPYQGFVLSKAYIGRDRPEPCLTAVQAVRLGDRLLGFVAADFEIGALPGTAAPCEGPRPWRQFRGDPAIRDALFLQARVSSLMDERAEEVLAIVTALMRHHGVFHSKLHFSSARVSLWHVDDPCSYRVHTGEEIVDPELFLVYPRRSYPARAVLAEEHIGAVLEQFLALRGVDDVVYLRAASLNLVNGMVGLTFSCDGSHYLPVEAFLDRQTEFWRSVDAGGAAIPPA